MHPDYGEAVALVHRCEQCGTPPAAGMRGEARQRSTYVFHWPFDLWQSEESLCRRLIRILILCLTLWGLFDVALHGILPLMTRTFDNPSREKCWCGDTDAQAVAIGCQYDHLAVDWLPKSCIDQDLVKEFDASGPGLDGAWTYFYMQRDEGNGELAFVPLSTNKTDDFALEGREYFATREWHILHCMFTWRKQFRARYHNNHIEPWNDNEEHIKHCSAYIMRTLKWNLSLDTVDTQILGVDRHRNEAKKQIVDVG